jgi:hypothetical protein
MDYLGGGDLRYHICKYRRFDEETTSKCSILKLLLSGFFVACLVAGLDVCHKK